MSVSSPRRPQVSAPSSDSDDADGGGGPVQLEDKKTHMKRLLIPRLTCLKLDPFIFNSSSGSEFKDSRCSLFFFKGFKPQEVIHEL